MGVLHKLLHRSEPRNICENSLISQLTPALLFQFKAPFAIFGAKSRYKLYCNFMISLKLILKKIADLNWVIEISRYL